MPGKGADMEETSAAGPGRPAASSTAELMKQLSEQVSQLARDELRLARLEMTRKGKRAGLGRGGLAGRADRRGGPAGHRGGCCPGRQGAAGQGHAAGT